MQVIKMERKINETGLFEGKIKTILGLLKQHNDTILRNNTELVSLLKRRETALRNLTEGEYSISENLDSMKKETHNLFASTQIISEATEVALSALEEQKKTWEIKYSNLDNATTGFSRIIGTISESIYSLRELGERIRKIEIAMDKIHNISHLTRGVSRNAGIKAYHAGEKGKGFEVIARELSQLTKESQRITVTVPEAIKRFQTQTKEAVNFITQLTHNIELVKKNTEDMKLKLKSSEQFLSEFMEVSNIIHNSVDKQVGVKEELGREEETISKFSTQLLIETGSITALEQSQSSLSLIINKFVENSSQIISSLEQKGDESFDVNIRKSSINNDKLKEYMLRVSSLTSQIKEISLEAKRHFESQKETVSQFLTVINENKMVKQEISKKTNSLMEILKEVTKLFLETNDLSEKIISIINEMIHLVERTDSYFSSLEKEIEWVVEIVRKLKKFSKRSNLLSLYASIETARAFEFKKELDVIVNQIKELSKQSSSLLRTIEESVNKAKSSLKNVHKIMLETSEKLENTKDEFKPMLKEFHNLIESTEKLNEIVNEMLNALEKQKGLEQNLISLEETLSSNIDENILMNRELGKVTEKTSSVVSELLNELGEFEKDLTPFLPSIQKLPKTVLRLRLSGDIIDIDPSKTTDATSNRVSTTIFKGLVEQGIDANVIPSIARRWKLSEDGLVWKFTLRDDVRFHNGEALNASDVKFTIEHLLSGPHSYMFDMIKGAKDFIRNKNKDIEGIKITGNYNIELKLNHPYIPFLRNLGVTCGGIAKETKNGLIGAGPFRLKKWEKGNRIILEAFDDYFGKKPYCDEIHFIICKDEKETFKRFSEGEFDIIDIPSSIEKEELLQKKEVNEINIDSLFIYDIYYVGINVKLQTPFKENMVRQALNYAVDRNEYIEKIAQDRGIPAKGIFPPNFSTYNKALTGYEYNPEKARTLLKNAGFPNGLPEEYQFDIRDSKTAVMGAEIIKKHLSEIGIHLKLNLLPWKELLRNVHSGKSLLFALGWANDNGDPDSFLYPLFHSKNWGEPGNTTFYKNKTVDRLLDKAAALTDHYKRQMLYQQVEHILVDDAPWIFLYHSKHTFACQPYIRGYSKSPLASERLEDVWFY